VFGDEQLTYGELNRRANQLAHYLAGLGVKPEDMVSICVERSLEMVVGLLGILKSGAAYVPLDPADPRDRLDFILKDTRATIVLTQTKLRVTIPKDSRVVCLEADWQRMAGSEDRNPNLNSRAGNLAYVMYTSGSTGRPKGVEIPHRGVVRLLCGSDYVSLTADEVLLQLAPLAFDASTFEIWGALLHGGVLVLMPPEQPTLEGIGRAIRDYKVTTLWLTAGLFHAMVNERTAELKSLRQLLTGGDVLSPALVRGAFQQLGDCRLINGYGPTESTTFACCHAVCRETHWERSVPIGRPIANTQIYILDAHLQPVPVGVVGELCIGGDGLARGYLNRPDLTAEKFIAHPFSAEPGARIYRTGDLARYLPDGNIEFLGRMDQQVKIRGHRVELEEIESTLQQHERVSQCVVSVQEDSVGEKLLVAWLVPGDPHGAPAIGGIREFLRHKLPEFMVPTIFEILPNLPLTPNGKIDRKALPALDLTLLRPVLEQQFVQARTTSELQLTQIWTRILNVSSIGVRDNFFDLGGHSLLAVRLVSEIHQSLHYSFPLAVFFQNPTIEAMARVIEKKKSAGSQGEVIAFQPGKSPGSVFFLDAESGMCRLAQLLDGGPALFGTFIPVSLAALKARVLPALEEVAAAHVALILSQQPCGPCVLAGYSSWGRLAFEVGHQLERKGHRVEMILLFDSWAIRPIWWDRLRTLTFAGAFASLRARYGRLRGRSLGRTDKVELPNQTFVPIAELPPYLFMRFVSKAYEGNLHPLDSRAVLFRAEDCRYSRREIWGKMGWDDLFTRGLDIVDVPGHHGSMLKSPNLAILAQRVQKCLDQIGTCCTAPLC
jgi:aspartate racemase